MKNKTKLGLISVAGLIGCTVLLSGCGPKQNSNNVDDADDTYVAYDINKLGDPKNLKANITWWDSFGGSSETATQTERLIKNFQDEYPNIKVKRTTQGGYDNLYNAVKTNIPAGKTPTMTICYPDHVGSYLGSKTVVRLDGYMDDPVIGFGKEKDKSVDDIFSSYLKEGQVYSKKGTYSLPFSKSTEVMFVNKGMLEEHNLEIPKTWKDLWDTAATLKEEVSTEGFIPVGYDSDDNLFITLCEQNGVEYTSRTNPHYKFDNPKAKQIAKDIQDKVTKGLLTTKGISKNNEFTSNMFTEGKLAFAIGSTGGTNYNYADKITIDVAAVPQVDTENLKVISQGPSVCMFNTSTQEERYAAFLFYKYITSTHASALLATKTGYNPVRKSSYETKIWKDWADNAGEGKDKLIFDTTHFVQEHYDEKNYFVSPVFKGSANARKQVGNIFAFVNAEVNNGKSVDDAINEAFTQAMNKCTVIKD